MNVRLTSDQKIKILNSQDLFKVMQQVLLRENKIRRNKEHFWIICLASNNRILLIELISLGTVKNTFVEPMDVFSFALQKRAVKIVMVHNHPSGELRPTKSDIQLTDKMLAIGRFINLPIIDHLIISEDQYYSFADSDLLETINKESKFDLSFNQIDALKKELINVEKKFRNIEKKRAITIANKMIEKNYPIKEIIELSGLTKMEIKKLMK